MTLKQTTNSPLFIRLCLCLMLALPAAVWAGDILQQETAMLQQETAMQDIGYLSLLFGAFFGGITSTFIKTEVDSNLNHVWLAKLIIGTGLGFFACLTWAAYDIKMTALKLAFPAFALGSLGAPIMVFLLTWAADSKTRAKAASKLESTLRLKDGE